MPRHFGRPGGSHKGGCAYLLGMLLTVYVGLWILTHWDSIW